MAKKLSNYALDIIIRNLILPIVMWVCEHSRAFCFIVIGVADQVTDVACVNSDELMADGAFAVASNPETAFALQGLSESVDILTKDFCKDPAYKNTLEAYDEPRQDDQYWFSIDINRGIRNNPMPQHIVKLDTPAHP